MTRDCACNLEHPRRRIVLTGGPGAGKTAVLELVRQSLCRHVTVLPESAGIVFGGGFPRRDNVGVKQAAQRAIYHVQRELESAAEAEGVNIVLCDRGCVDGAAYWIGVEDFWTALGTTREALLARYDVVVHLRVPGAANGYGHQNPLRVESVAEALVSLTVSWNTSASPATPTSGAVNVGWIGFVRSRAAKGPPSWVQV